MVSSRVAAAPTPTGCKHRVWHIHNSAQLASGAATLGIPAGTLAAGPGSLI